MCPPAPHVRYLLTRPILTILGICSSDPHFMNETDHRGPSSPAGKLLLAQTQVVWLRERSVTPFPMCHSVGIFQLSFCLQNYPCFSFLFPPSLFHCLRVLLPETSKGEVRINASISMLKRIHFIFCILML